MLSNQLYSKLIKANSSTDDDHI